MTTARWMLAALTAVFVLAGCSRDSRPAAVKHAVEAALYNTTGCHPFEVRNVRLSNIESKGKDKFNATVDLDLVARMSKADADRICNDPKRDVPMLHDPSMGDRMVLTWQIMELDDALRAGKPMRKAGDTVHVPHAELHLFRAADGWRLAGDHS